MKRPIVYALTRYVKGQKKTTKSYGFYNEDTNTLVLNIGKNKDGSDKWLVKQAQYISAVPGKSDEFTMKISNLYEKSVPVYDTKSRQKVVKGYDNVLSYSHSYLWYKFKK